MSVMELVRRVRGGKAAPMRQRRDLISLLAMLGLAYLAAGSIHDVRWTAGTGALILFAMMAVLLAYRLAGGTRRARSAVGIGMGFGVVAILLTVGSLWPPLEYLRADWAALPDWFARLTSADWRAAGGPAPEAGAYVVRQVIALVDRVTIWAVRVYAGLPNSDQRVWLLLVSLVLYSLTFASAWQLFRHWRPSVAVLLLGTALGTNGFMAGQSPQWALWFIGLAVIFLARGSAKQLEERWRRRGTDYSEELLPYATIIGLVVAAIVVVVSPTLPFLTSRATYDAFWKVLREPWQRVEESTGKLFQGLNSPPRVDPMRRGGGDRPDPSGSHAVGSTAPHGSSELFSVRTSDPAPEPWAGGYRDLERGVIPQRHWRVATYDTYTGSEWLNPERQPAELAPESELAVPNCEARAEFVQEVYRCEDSDVLIAAGQPLRFSQSVDATLRPDGEAISLAGTQDSYVVTSLVPNVTVSDLEATGTDYPPEVALRYLALPPVSQRVRDVTGEVVAGAQNSYAVARALEDYLRQLPYDPEVPLLPPEREVTDYLLFELQRGYCDHFSTAMAVMLRLQGVPARVAVGYARGQYDFERGRWLVSQADAHAWTEVYFPGIGWVEFEPTPSQDVYVFPYGGSWERSSQPPAPPAQPTQWWRNLQWRGWLGWAVYGALGGLAILLLVRGARWLNRGTERRIADSFASVVAAAEWVGVRQDEHETVREYWARLRTTLEREIVVASTPWGSDLTWDFQRVAPSLRYVLSAYERSLFAEGRVPPGIAARVAEEVTRLRRQFALLWIARHLGE